MEDFLLAAGLALLLALLGWSEQFRNLHKETLEIEKEFCKGRNIKWNQIRLLIKKDVEPAKQIIALNEIINLEKINDIEDINFIKEFRNLDLKRNEIEKMYKRKYVLIIVLTFLFYFSGLFNYFISADSCTTIFFKIPTKFIPVLICSLFSLATLVYATFINHFENIYREKFQDLMDKL